MRAELTVACDGRCSTVRSAAGPIPRSFGVPMDVRWFRLPRRSGDPRGSAWVLRAGHAVIMIDRSEYYQIAYIVPKGTDTQTRARGIETLRRALATLVPWPADRVATLTSFEHMKLLDVQLNRLPRWYGDGGLLIGDFAQVMSPVGGIGINLAVADAVARRTRTGQAAARAGRISTRQPARVQVRRWLPTVILRAAQRLIPDRAKRGRRAPRACLPIGCFRRGNGLRRRPIGHRRGRSGRICRSGSRYRAIA